MAEQIVKSKIKCPKCKSINLTLCEVWQGHTINWEHIDGEFDVQDGALEMGDAFKVQAFCHKCKNAWTIRKALQIGSCYH